MRISDQVLGLLVGGVGGVGGKGLDLSGLRAGDVLDARVLEILEDMVLLGVRGEKIAARTEVPLEGNQHVKLVYQGNADGEARFKIDSSMNGVPQGEDGVVTVLESMGVKATEKNVEIVKGLLLNKLPVDSETIKVLGKVLPEGHAPHFKEKVQQAITLLKMDLPLNKENVDVLFSSFESNKTDELKPLKVLEQLFNIKDDMVALGNKTTSKESREELLKSALARFDEGVTKSANPVNVENKGSQEPLINIHVSDKNLISSVVREGLESGSKLEVIREVITKFAEVFEVRGTVEDVERAISTMFKENTTVKLFELLNELSKIEKMPLQEQKDVFRVVKLQDTVEVSDKLQETKGHIIDMVKGLAKDTLMTIQDRPLVENNNVYLNIPLNIDDTWYEAKLQINSSLDEERKTDFNQKVFVRIDVATKNLGSVGVKLEILSKGVTCTVFVDNDDSYGIFAGATKELREILSENYSDVIVNVERVSNDTYIAEDNVGDIKFSRMDLRV